MRETGKGCGGWRERGECQHLQAGATVPKHSRAPLGHLSQEATGGPLISYTVRYGVNKAGPGVLWGSLYPHFLGRVQKGAE